MMNRSNTFNPEDIQTFVDDASRYVYSEEIKTAVRVALATERPLLVRGVPGSGKSTLAKNVALTLGWRFREVIVTSRTQAKDLAYRFDSLRKLQDAYAKNLRADSAYVSPGALFWAFAPAQANQLVREGERETRLETPCVVLLDEIDKADPDVPNDLLVTFGELRFVIEETDEKVSAPSELRPLLIATTNDERSLPPAFLRRCIVLQLSPPDLLSIARTHFGADDEGLYKTVLTKHEEIVKIMEDLGLRAPSTAEYLDTIAACRALGTDQLDQIVNLTLKKERPPKDA